MARLLVLASPGKRATAVTGFEPWRRAWAVDLAARPEQGKANRELVRYLATLLDASPAAIHVVRGAAARLKEVTLEGFSQDRVDGRLREEAARRRR